jgi:hypothetical protein
MGHHGAEWIQRDKPQAQKFIFLFVVSGAFFLPTIDEKITVFMPE